MPQTLDLSHLRSLLQSFAFVGHEALKLTTKETKDTKNLRNGREAALRRLPFAAAVRALPLAMRRVWHWLILAEVALAGCERAHTSVADYAAQRERMVKEQLVMRGINAERVLAAMNKVPREEFVPENFRAASYTDQPLPIGHDQTISQPYIVAFMTEELQPQPQDRVLRLNRLRLSGGDPGGAGGGSLLIEIIEPLAKPLKRRCNVSVTKMCT